MPQEISGISGWMPFIWFLLAIALGVAEAATVDLVAIWFALGSLAAILPAALGAPFSVQLIVCLAVSMLALAFTRPAAKRLLKVNKTSTNYDRVIGMVGVVTQRISNVDGEGRVEVDGMGWSARSEDGEPIDKGEQVLVKSVSGVKLIVDRLV